MEENNEKKYIVPFWVYRVVLVILICIALHLALEDVRSCNPKDYDVFADKRNTNYTSAASDKEKKNEVTVPNFSLAKCPFEVTETFVYTDTAGGVDLILYYDVGSVNKTNEIKYVYLYATPYNRVGDIESSEIGGKTTAKCRLIGPYKQGDGGSLTFEDVWYNYAISKVKIDKIEIEFMNGLTATYS